MKTTIVGIDPGKSGGICFLSPDGVRLEPLPFLGDEPDITRYDFSQVVRVAIEKPAPRPGNGSKQSWQSGYWYGQLIMHFKMLGIPVHEVAPVTWTKKMLGGKNTDKTASLGACAKLFPTIDLVRPGCRKQHDGMADALLIAEFGRVYL